ncbi:MAG: hypothetical protein VB120_01015 [Lachnospiraceae bacterium]|nr:hypothetical protein [Lachnospiraceae bacterium]
MDKNIVKKLSLIFIFSVAIMAAAVGVTAINVSNSSSPEIIEAFFFQ